MPDSSVFIYEDGADLNVVLFNHAILLVKGACTPSLH